MVTASFPKIGKNGKPYASFTLEDYMDSMTLFLYAEDYLKWKHLIDTGTFLLIKARIESRFDAPDQYRTKITSMSLLSEAMEKYGTVLYVTLPVEIVNADLIRDFNEIFRKHKGKTRLRIRITDREENLTVELPSRKFHVMPRDVIDLLAKYEEVETRISQE